ncbi:hypothetical protein ABPG74_005031 [Tetrahymena malaccensis]
MLNEKEYLINEIQQNCRINSPSRNGSPYKKRDKLFNEQQKQRSKSEFENKRLINKKKNIIQEQDYRNQYYQNILTLPFNDPRPTQEMVMILMKNPAVRQECEIIFLTQILCQYPFFSKIKQQYGLQVLQYISQLAFYKRYDANANIDFLENSNLILKDPKDQSNEAGVQILLVLLNGQAVTQKIKQANTQNKTQNCQNYEAAFQVGQPLQKLNINNLMVDQGQFISQQKEYQFLTHSICEFIAISIQDYHSIIQRTLIRQQKIKQIEIQILNRNEEVVKQYKFLKKIPIFQQFSDADIYDVMVNMTLERLTHGQTLYKQGDKVEGVYLIYCGEFQVMKKQERLNQVIQCEALQVVKDVNKFIPNMDQSLIVSVIKEGEIFGFEEIIQNIQQRQYTVESSAINSFVLFMKAQYFQKKFNRLINNTEYSQLVKLTEEKIMHRQQFQDKQEYLAYNLLEDIKNSSLGYQIFSKIKEDLDNSNLNQLQKRKQSNDNQFTQIGNTENNKIYRKRLNQDSINFLEKSLSPLQKTLPFLNKNTQNQSSLQQNQFTNLQNKVKQYQQQSYIQLQNTQSQLNKEQNNLMSKNNYMNRSKTPNQEINLENNSFLQTKQNTTAISQFINTNNSTNRQKRTIDFLRESRCLTTQGDEIENIIEQPFQSNKYQRPLYSQKWNFKRKKKYQQAHQTQQNCDITEQQNELTSPNQMNNSLQLLDTENYDRLFLFVKSKDQERVQRNLNNQNFGVVRAVEIESLENGQVIQKIIQTQPNESSDQFEFSNQIDDLKPIVQKRRQIYQEIKKAILNQTNQQDIGIQIHDELNAPKYLKIKQQRIKECNSNSPKKEKRTNENTFINERSILMKFLKDKQNYEGNMIVQNSEIAPVFNHKKYSVQLGSNFEQNCNYNSFDKQETDCKKLYLSQRTSPHSQRPISRINPQLQYFQSKKIDDNQRVIQRGDRQIKFRDNRSPPKLLQIQ